MKCYGQLWTLSTDEVIFNIKDLQICCPDETLVRFRNVLLMEKETKII